MSIFQFQLHGRQFIAATFLSQITGPKSAERSASLNNVLHNILELYLVQTVLNHMNDILLVVLNIIPDYLHR